MRPDGQAPYTCVRNCARPSVHTVTKLTEPASQPAAEPAPGYQHRTHVQLGRYHAHCALFTPLTKHAHMRINAPRAVPACHHRICLICMRRAYVPHGRPPVGPTDVDGLRLRHRATGRAPDYRLRWRCICTRLLHTILCTRGLLVRHLCRDVRVRVRPRWAACEQTSAVLIPVLPVSCRMRPFPKLRKVSSGMSNFASAYSPVGLNKLEFLLDYCKMLAFCNKTNDTGMHPFLAQILYSGSGCMRPVQY